ncbi:conserved hypothetical protein [Candidatus Terasakiella magnetica]|nr:conserved hypothetical protein [Candidatus Terasakiella magnetica]
MTIRGSGIALIWLGMAVLLGLLIHRFRRGAWSLDDDQIPVTTARQQGVFAAALTLTVLGTGLVIWDFW